MNQAQNTSSSVFGVFGYGSLVNPDTLRTSYISTHRARVRGWRRQWLRRPKGVGDFALVDNLAFLSATLHHPDAWIDGMVVLDRSENLPALDRREALYDRVEVHPDHIEWLDDAPDHERDTPLFIYTAQAEASGDDLMILRSYLDAVLQGYHRAFGEKGIEDFLSSTTPDRLPMLEDRHAPIYPRSVVLEAYEQAIVDRHVPGHR